jgi:DNA helicase IV
MHLISGRTQVSIIPGIAGTGKTHIAIAEAKKAHQRGDRTLFVCFNSLLSKYLKSELAGYSLVEVHTISEFMLKVAGKKFNDATGSAWWRTELPEMAQEAIIESRAFDSFDVLIVDEAQDLSIPAYLDVLDLALTKGFAKSPVMLFGDFTHQAVYVPGDVAMKNLLEKVPDAIDYQLLSINCRNTKQIGETVMQILKEHGAYSSYRRKDEGVMPTLISLKQGESAVRHVRENINRLAKTYSLDHVVLLSSSKVQLEELVKEVGLPATDLDFPLPGKFRWGTSQAFKGMESPAVILVEFEDAGVATRETFYVAGTRAISELVCVVPLSVMQEISQG